MPTIDQASNQAHSDHHTGRACHQLDSPSNDIEHKAACDSNYKAPAIDDYLYLGLRLCLGDSRLR